jgi:hypothetical protein
LLRHLISRRLQHSADRRLWRDELARLRTDIRNLPSDFDRVVALREYVGRLIGVGQPDPTTAELYRTVDFASFDPAKFYTLFREQRQPAECGITSFFYIMLLQACGFRAWQYSFGFRHAPYRRFIHSVALVEVGSRLVIQDPYLNLTYRTTSQEPMDFFEFLRAVRERRYSSIVTDSPPLTTFLTVHDPAQYNCQMDDTRKALFTAALQKDNGAFATEIPVIRNYETFMKSPGDDFESGFAAALRSNGFDEPFLYAWLLRAADLVGSAGYLALRRKIDAALASIQRLDRHS